VSFRPASRTPRLCQSGATTAEFAVILPLVVAVMFGTIEAGRMAVSRAMLSYASIQGSRVAGAMGTPTVADVQAAVQSAAPMLGLPSGSITVTVSGGKAFAARALGDTVTVALNYQFQPVIPVPGFSGATWNDANTVFVGD
jgi:Flp pilus assembly protein TadG